VKASGEGEGIEDPAELGHRSHVASEQNEGVVGILENGVMVGLIGWQSSPLADACWMSL